MKVFLSASSQDGNIGAVSGYVESAVNKRIDDVSERELKRHGVETMRNVPGDTFTQRTDRSNAWGADIHSCSHTNANNRLTKGITYIGCFNAANASLKSTKLANICAAEVRKAFPERIVKIVTYTFHEVTKTNAPCVYFEWGFHDNLEDCKWILAHIEDIGIVQAKGHLAYFGIAYAAAVVPPVVPPAVILPTPSAPATGIVVGGTYSVAVVGNTSSDGKGVPYIAMSMPGKCLKISAGTMYPYGMDLKGAGYVTAWFPASAIK